MNWRAVCTKTDGSGMVIEVCSEDHGSTGSKSSPARAHLKTPDNTYLGKFAITAQSPRNNKYVFDCDKNTLISAAYKEKIARWANIKNKELGSLNWAALRYAWKILHP
jgi:hypothetical protein